MSNQPGRPRLLDDLKRRDVCTLIAAGCGLPEAARYVGCSVSTLRREIAGREDFREHLRAAERDAQLETLRAMRKAAATHWRAAAWMLERTHPHRFGRQHVRSNVDQQLGVVIEEVIAAAAEEIQDRETRERVCSRLYTAARNAARSLHPTGALQSPPRASKQPPQSDDDRDIDRLLAEIERDRRQALKTLLSKNQNPFNFDAPSS